MLDCSSTAVHTESIDNQLRIDKARISSIDYSSDAKMLAAAGSTIVKIWDSAKLLYELEQDGNVKEIAFAHSGKFLAVAVNDPRRRTASTVSFWSLSTGQKLSEYTEKENPISTIALSSDENLLSVGLFNGKVKLFDIKDINNIKSINQQFADFGSAISAISFSKDSSLLAIGVGSGQANGGKVSVIKIADKQELYSSSKMKNILNLKFSPDNSLLVFAGIVVQPEATFALSIIGTEDWKEQEFIKDYPCGKGLAFSNNSSLLISGAQFADSGATLAIKDLKSKTVKLLQESFILTSMALSPDGKKVALGSDNGKIKIRNL